MSTRNDSRLPGDRQTAGVRRWAIKTVAFLAIMAFCLFGSAGTVDWSGAWRYLTLMAANQVLLAAVLLPRHPELLAERSEIRHGAKPWDPPLAADMAIAGPLVMAIVSGLDVRYNWIGYVPPEEVRLALAAAVAGSLLTIWAMAVNAFFSGVVRIQKERGHHVVSSGPYRLVRHPGYVGALLVTIATPYVLGSRWAVFPSWIVMAAILVRTWLEDRTLRAELGGYREYCLKVGYRLIPGLW